MTSVATRQRRNRRRCREAAGQLLALFGYPAAMKGLAWLATPHCYLPAGLQLLALVLSPGRYWPALALGGVLAQWPLPAGSGSWLGWRVFPTELLLMPLVYAGRRWGWLPRPGQWARQVRILAVLLLMLLAAMLVPGWELAISNGAYPDPSTPPDPDWLHGPSLQRRIIGHYLGIFALVPIGILAIYTSHRVTLRSGWQQLRAGWAGVNLGVALYGVITLYACNRMISGGSPDLQMIMRDAFLLVAGWATAKLGWEGAALIGSLSVWCLAALIPAPYTSLSLSAEYLLGGGFSWILLQGILSSRTRAEEAEEQAAMRRFIEEMQHFQRLTEWRFQNLGSWLYQIAQGGQARTRRQRRGSWRLQYMLPPSSEAAVSGDFNFPALPSPFADAELAAVPRRQPSTPPTTFAELARLLQTLEIDFRYLPIGNLLGLSAATKADFYRAMVDTSIYLASQPEEYDCIEAMVRGLKTSRGHWVLVRVEAMRQRTGAISLHGVYRHEERIRQMEQGTRCKVCLARLEAIVKRHHGQLRQRRAPRRQSLSLLLNDKI